MAELQRSSVSFRRQGSSGLIWDDKFLSGELKQFPSRKPPSSSDVDHTPAAENHQSECSNTTVRSINTVRRNRSTSGGGPAFPAAEPPSPRVRVCGLCRVFGKPDKTNTRKRSFA